MYDSSGVLVAGEGLIKSNSTTAGLTPTTFTGVTRGQNGTDAEAHSDNAQVYNRDAATLNRGLNFNVGATGSSTGTFGVISMTLGFIFKSLPNLVIWNFSFLDGLLVYFRLFLMAVSVGVVIYFGILFISSATGILLRS